MTGITSGIGLASGLPIQDIVDQLIEASSRPKQLVELNILEMQTKQAAFDTLNATLIDLQGASSGLTASLLNSRTVTSSNTGVLSASAGSQTPSGSYNFFVRNLVSSQQSLSKGFTDSEAALGTATTLSFNDKRASFASQTSLDQLNGGSGVDRGFILVRDQSGASSVVDLTQAVTVDDVIEAINSNTGVSVTASVEDDQLKLTDTTGSNSTSVLVANVGSDTTATDLGLTSLTQNGTEYTGTDINDLGTETLLSSLNDSLGVGTVTGNDLNLTAGAVNLDLDLSDAQNLQDVIDTINNDAANTGADAITASLNGNGIELSSASAINVTALNSSTAARDLGLEGVAAATTITGDDILASLNSSLLKNASAGASGTPLNRGEIDINGTAVDLTNAQSISDVVSAINAETGTTNVTASIDNSTGKLLLTEGANGAINVSDNTGNTAAYLGIANSATGTLTSTSSRQFISGQTTLASLNGGAGVRNGSFIITDANGSSTGVNVGPDDTTIQDVLDEINATSIDINARINDDGSGIIIEDTSGGGGLSIRVEEFGSRTAEDLNILGTANGAGSDIDGSFNRSIEIEATDSLSDIAQKINDADIDITASVLNDGSGIAPFRLNISGDNAGSEAGFLIDEGNLDLDISTVTEARDAAVFYGASAKDGLLIQSETNTIEDVVAGLDVSLLSASSNPVTVTINEDTQPIKAQLQTFVDQFNVVVATLDELDRYDPDTQERGILLGDSTLQNIERRLFSSITSAADLDSEFTLFSQIGISLQRGGTLAFDSAKFDEAYNNNPDAVEDLLAFSPNITNSSRFENLRVSGSTFDTDPTGNDIAFTDKDGTTYEFNIDAFNTLDSFFNSIESQTGGNITAQIDGRRVVFSDNTGGSGDFIIDDLGASNVASQLNINGTFSSSSEVTSTLITVEASNTQLGLGRRVTNVLQGFTDRFDGLITNATDTLNSQIELATDRVDLLQSQLDTERERLLAQFTAMELAIASMQSQQNALAALGG